MTGNNDNKATFALVWLALVVIQLGFGAYGVVISKFAKNNNVDPLVFCLLRDGFCFPVLFLAGYIAEKKIVIPTKRELPLFIAMGFIGMFCNQLLYILGVYYTTANTASMFQPIIPVWTSIIAVIARIEKLPNFKKINGIAKVLGILIAVVGAIVMTLGKASKHSGHTKTSRSPTVGYISLLGNTISMATYVVIQRKYIFAVPTSRWLNRPIIVTAWAYLFGFISMLIASLYYVNKPEKFESVSSDTVYPLIYAVFIASALCYMLITWCNMQMNSSIVTASWPLQVFFCVILAYFVLGEFLSGLEICGGILIIVSLLLVVWSNYREMKEDNNDPTKAKLLNGDND